VPARLVAAMSARFGIVAVRPPLNPGIDEQFLFHPTRLHADPAFVWLRTLVLDVAKGLDRPAA
jgi:hypothetical protein